MRRVADDSAQTVRRGKARIEENGVVGGEVLTIAAEALAHVAFLGERPCGPRGDVRAIGRDVLDRDRIVELPVANRVERPPEGAEPDARSACLAIDDAGE